MLLYSVSNHEGSLDTFLGYKYRRISLFRFQTQRLTSKQETHNMPHTKLIFVVKVNGDDYIKNQVYTAPSVPEALFNRVVNEYLMDDFGVLPDECTIDKSQVPYVVHINSHYTGPLDEFMSASEPVVVKKRKRVIEDSDSEDDDVVSTKSYTSEAIIISDSEDSDDVSEDSDDDSIIEVSSDEEEPEPEPQLKRRKVDNPDVSTTSSPSVPSTYNQAHVVYKALVKLNRPVTRMDIYKYFVDNNLLHIYEKDQPPASFSSEHFVTQRATTSLYCGRISRSLWTLNNDGVVTISKVDGKNVYSLI